MSRVAMRCPRRWVREGGRVEGVRLLGEGARELLVELVDLGGAEVEELAGASERACHM
jgi:hypothetical protein